MNHSLIRKKAINKNEKKTPIKLQYLIFTEFPK